jgi:lipopolysaccharide/colanic/teichoic acid biosynthesis glycosyltransferase
VGIKRVFDIICALCGLIILSPVLLLIIVLIKLTSTGPVFFRQTRVGQYERLFQIHKFRTMIVNAEASGLKITVGRDPRITSIGHFLRKTKLDELPQLIDVLMGTMSLVGPRPEVPEYVQYYTNEIKAIVLSVRPGITDWASIKMIDENDILARASDPQQAYIQQILPEKLAYAVRYVQTRSLKLDVYLILLTISKIFTR